MNETSGFQIVFHLEVGEILSPQCLVILFYFLIGHSRKFQMNRGLKERRRDIERNVKTTALDQCVK